MARKPVPKLLYIFHPINGGLALALALLFAFAVADSRRNMPSVAAIIATYAIGLIITVVGCFWDFRWKRELYTLGQVIIIYSITVLILAGQFLLALGAFLLVITVMLYPAARAIRRQIRQQIRDGLL